MTKVRHNVGNLPLGDQTLSWYGRAIGEMQKRPIKDSTSWRFQAAIHDYDRATDPLAVTGEALPSGRIRRTFWSQCQHNSWFFLPWHRMYLHFFEEVIAAEVVKLGGPADWALPYWNYSTDVPARLLPDAFRSPTLPDGSKNYLYVAERDPTCNAGQQFADEFDVALKTALIQPVFSDATTGAFGGPPTVFSHSGNTFGQLERTPHGSIHSTVGGQNGWMGAFNTAGLDPIFWLHHANIDRLWQVWLNRDAAHQNPTNLQWLNTISFAFHDATQQIVTMRCSEVVDTNALGYAYDEVRDPLAVPVLAATISPALIMANRNPPELVGATETSFQIHQVAVHINVPTPAHAAVRMSLAADTSAPPRVFLNLENLTARGRAHSFDVYVNIPEGVEETQHPERRAGRLELFGIAEASRATDQHAGSGLTYTLDISDLYQQLSTEAGWDPEHIRVSLVPVRKWVGAKVTVGRVSLFFG